MEACRVEACPSSRRKALRRVHPMAVHLTAMVHCTDTRSRECRSREWRRGRHEGRRRGLQGCAQDGGQQRHHRSSQEAVDGRSSRQMGGGIKQERKLEGGSSSHHRRRRRRARGRARRREVDGSKRRRRRRACMATACMVARHDGARPPQASQCGQMRCHREDCRTADRRCMADHRCMAGWRRMPDRSMQGRRKRGQRRECHLDQAHHSALHRRGRCRVVVCMECKGRRRCRWHHWRSRRRSRRRCPMSQRMERLTDEPLLLVLLSALSLSLLPCLLRIGEVAPLDGSR